MKKVWVVLTCGPLPFDHVMRAGRFDSEQAAADHLAGMVASPSAPEGQLYWVQPALVKKDAVAPPAGEGGGT